MKDDNIKHFFTEHKQEIPDEGFSNRLFAVLGGYSILIEGLSSMGGIFVNYKSATPEIVIAMIFTFCALFALGRYAITDTQE